MFKKEQKLERYYVDADGSLSYVHNKGDPKVRCTLMHVKTGGTFRYKTLSNNELKNVFCPEGGDDSPSSPGSSPGSSPHVAASNRASRRQLYSQRNN